VTTPHAQRFPAWLFPVLFAAFVFLCALNSAGYRYGASDLAFYAPAILEQIDPALFPRDGPLIAAQARLTTIDEAIALLARLTGQGLPVLLGALHVFSLALIASGVWLIGRRLYRTDWTSLALIAALTLRHAIARSGTNTLEGYFHPRQLAFGFGALAIAALLRRRYAATAALVLTSGFIHPTTALWFGVWAAVATAVNEPRMRAPLAGAAGLAALVGAWALTAGPLGGRLIIMDAEWLATLGTKDYLFPLGWPLHAWLINVAYAPLIVLVYRRRRADGVTIPGETGLVAGCLALFAIFVLALPLNAIRVALVVQLQIPRIFWMLDFMATVYAVWALAEGARGTVRRAQITAGIIALASTTRGAYVMLLKFPERPVAQTGIPDNDWGRAMAWARSTPRDTEWVAHPNHAAHYGTSLRLAGERDVLVEAVKDAAIGMYERDVAIRTRDHLKELADFDAMTPEQARSLAARHGLDYLVTERTLDLPLAFASGEVRIYRLR
jgi:hypothetical protein